MGDDSLELKCILYKITRAGEELFPDHPAKNVFDFLGDNATGRMGFYPKIRAYEIFREMIGDYLTFCRNSSLDGLIYVGTRTKTFSEIEYHLKLLDEISFVSILGEKETEDIITNSNRKRLLEEGFEEAEIFKGNEILVNPSSQELNPQIFNSTRYGFRRYFEEVTGEPPQDYLRREVLDYNGKNPLGERDGFFYDTVSDRNKIEQWLGSLLELNPSYLRCRHVGFDAIYYDHPAGAISISKWGVVHEHAQGTRQYRNKGTGTKAFKKFKLKSS